jgi:hypothetical protein
MPLQLFLQVLGHTRAIDNLEVLIAKSAKVGELPVSLRYVLLTLLSFLAAPFGASNQLVLETRLIHLYLSYHIGSFPI